MAHMVGGFLKTGTPWNLKDTCDIFPMPGKDSTRVVLRNSLVFSAGFPHRVRSAGHSIDTNVYDFSRKLTVGTILVSMMRET